MKKKLLIGLGTIVLVVIVLAVLSPRELKIEREVTINKPKNLVFEQLKYVKNHNSWSPWAKLDPNMKIESKGTDGTIGYVQSWEGNDQVGTGEQEILAITEGEKIEMAIRFKKPFEDNSNAYLSTQSLSDQQTRVVWGMYGPLPFPKNIICFMMNMPKMLGQQLDQGLADLKTQLEK